MKKIILSLLFVILSVSLSYSQENDSTHVNIDLTIEGQFLIPDTSSQFKNQFFLPLALLPNGFTEYEWNQISPLIELLHIKIRELFLLRGVK